VVEDGVTGFLVKPNNNADLTEKMERMLNLSKQSGARWEANHERKSFANLMSDGS
jgi:Glycosyl transferases group 1.